MAESPDQLPPEVERVLACFFEDRSIGQGIVGGLDEPDNTAVREAAIGDRLRQLERVYLDHLDLMAVQHDEITLYGEDYAKQLYGEVVATLIALRELWAFVPELRE